MKTFLVPIDFSENASNALEYAIELAKKVQGAIKLVHVYRPSVSHYNPISPLITQETALAKEEFRRKLQIICDTIKNEFPTVNADCVVLVGEPVDEILKATEVFKVDMVVMGTQGASKIDKLFFGSNTSSIIEKTRCPVLAIPFHVRFKLPKKIIYATSFSYHEIEGAVQLTEIAKALDAEIIFSHVVVASSKAEKSATLDKFTTEVRWLTDYPKLSQKILKENTISMGLDELIEQTRADMIAFSTRRRSLFEKMYNPSLTKKFSIHTHIPLLAFHNTAETDEPSIFE